MIDAGNAKEMDAAFREGKGQYIHQQGPAPQQLEADGVGFIVAALGPMVGSCAFSSLAAMPEWLSSDEGAAFMRAYAKTRAYMNTTSARDIAKAEKPLFPNIEEDVLADCIAAYQNMGCWPPEMHITDKGFEAMLDIFAHDGKITTRHAYDDICLRLP